MIITVDKSYRHKRDLTEQQLFAVVEQNTPDSIKPALFPQDEPNAFTFHLDKELIARLNLWEWFRNYAKEAQVSTAGIRGPQNILYPWDTRFPINQVGIVLATLGKSLVANENAGGKQVEKIAGCEVRYNSQKYVEHIARIQAAQGIRTYVPKSFGTLPIWMASFLIFMLDLDGGEHVTSSHSVSTKNATKDLNNQGSQYLPEESMRFVNKIEEILKAAEMEGYTIQFSAATDEHIDFERLDELHDGVQLYVGYLKGGVATDANLKLIRAMKPSIVVDCVGGCMYRPMRAIFERLGSLTLFAGSTLRQTRSITTSENSIRIRKRAKLNFTISVATLVSLMSSNPQITQQNSNRNPSGPLLKRLTQMAIDSSSVR